MRHIKSKLQRESLVPLSLSLGVSDAPLYIYEFSIYLYVLYSMSRNSSALSN